MRGRFQFLSLFLFVTFVTNLAAHAEEGLQCEALFRPVPTRKPVKSVDAADGAKRRHLSRRDPRMQVFYGDSAGILELRGLKHGGVDISAFDMDPSLRVFHQELVMSHPTSEANSVFILVESDSFKNGSTSLRLNKLSPDAELVFYEEGFRYDRDGEDVAILLPFYGIDETAHRWRVLFFRAEVEIGQHSYVMSVELDQYQANDGTWIVQDTGFVVERPLAIPPEVLYRLN